MALPPINFGNMNEDVFFLVYQDILLGIANTNVGRDLLCIPKEYPKIIGFRKNCIHWRNPDGSFGADFRIGAKWANVIRHRWGTFSSYARYFIANRDNLNLPMSKAVREKRAVMASTLTAYPDPNVETTTVDGSIENDSTGPETWDDMHTALADATAQDTGATAIHCKSASVGAGDLRLARGIYLYDTSSIGASSTVSAATHSLVWSSGAGGIFRNDDLTSMYITPCSPAANTAVVTTDWTTFTFTDYGHQTFASATRDDATYTDLALNATGYGAVSKTGITKLGTVCAPDFVNTEPGGENYARVLQSETAGTTKDPKLVVTYTGSAPATNSNFLMMM